MCNLYGGALISEHQTNQNSSKIQENQKEIHEPSSIFYPNFIPPFPLPLKLSATKFEHSYWSTGLWTGTISGHEINDH